MMNWSTYVIFIFNFYNLINSKTIKNETVSTLPVVIWHGMGDSCCYSFSMGKIKTVIEDELPGVYVLSLKIGNSIPEDVENGYFLPVSKQLDIACSIISQDKNLQQGYNALGFSQGGQFLRALVQKCPQPPMKNLVTFGAQHQGVYGIPNCSTLNHTTCNFIRKLLNYAAYKSWVQHYLVQASYWHDPLNEDEYRKGSIFLADINNENIVNEDYKRNLQSLNKLVLVKFENDTMVNPVESEWFGFFKSGQAVEVQKLQDTDIYKQDRLGLKQMDADGKLVFISLKGNHLKFSMQWFVKNIIHQFLN